MKGLLLGAALAFYAGDSGLKDQTAALSDEILQHGKAYADLHELTDIGSRLAASPGAERAVAWAKAKMEAYGFDKVRLQATQVPVWTRGDTERATLTDGADAVAPLRVAALGGSVGTGEAGVEAQVVEVHSLDEVARLGSAVRGKIVFYNRPMDPNLADTFTAYSRAVDQRTAGPSVAARYGAVAVLVRTLTPQLDDDHPHTGMLSYNIGDPKIPAAAVSTHGANELSRRLAANPQLHVKLELACARNGTATGYNIIGEVTGSEKPNEIVVVGGHIDSWDLGPAAHDDGAGVVQSLEVGRAIKALGLRPKRTIRTVLFMAEEEGGWGADTYAQAARSSGETHIAAIESDRGGFAPTGFATTGGASAVQKLKAFAPLLAPLHADEITEGDSGTDVEPLRAVGAVAIGFIPVSTHYFDFHHAETDVFAAVRPDELHAGAAAIATLAWSIAEQGL